MEQDESREARMTTRMPRAGYADAEGVARSEGVERICNQSTKDGEEAATSTPETPNRKP